MKIGDILVKECLITREQLKKALATQKKSPPKTIDAVLIELGIFKKYCIKKWDY